MKIWISLLLALVVVLFFVPFKYAYEPSEASNEKQRTIPAAFDHWGEAKSITEPGAVEINPDLLAEGRTAFYKETFLNEVFLSDVMGMLNGAVTPTSFAEAILALKGHGTTNLRVAIARDAVVGGREFIKGEMVDTGLDVAEGTYTILGMQMSEQAGKIRAGITCAACHSTVDPLNFKVVHGAPNSDFNLGLLLALASNSSAFFPHTDVNPVSLGGGQIPSVEKLEDAVDKVFLQWPPGSFDSMVDNAAAPTKLPSSFTFANWPYSYSGAFMAGPFNGLSVQTNNVHALNSDTLALADQATVHFGMSRDQYLTTVLRNSASDQYRFNKGKVSEFLDSIDPTPGQPGLNEMVALPTYPKSSLASPTSLWNSSPGETVWRKVNAMSAWQNTIIPARATNAVSAESEMYRSGRQVFERANCVSCHSSATLAGNRIVPLEEIKTQGVRARSMRNNQKLSVEKTLGYSFDERVPLRPDAKVIEIPFPKLGAKQRDLSMAWSGTEGGFKIPALVGLYWTVPYLHDGGIAVGIDPTQVGVSATLNKFIRPDPGQSLRALVDRSLRTRVVEANHADSRLRAMHVEGIGHEYWVDEKAGFNLRDQEALIAYLLSIEG